MVKEAQAWHLSRRGGSRHVIKSFPFNLSNRVRSTRVRQTLCCSSDESEDLRVESAFKHETCRIAETGKCLRASVRTPDRLLTYNLHTLSYLRVGTEADSASNK